MIFARGRPIFQIGYRATRISRKYFSTQKRHLTILQSRGLRAVALGLAIGIPGGYLAKRAYPDTHAVKSGNDFYEGSPEWRGKVIREFTLEDVDAWISKEESTHNGPPGSGVKEWHSVRCPSNSPCEDDLVAARSPVSGDPEKPWLFWGVFDGHIGWSMSATLRETLVPYVSRHLSQLFQSGSPASPEAIDDAIRSSFVKLDDEIAADAIGALTEAKSLGDALSRIALGYSGSCALLSMFDPKSKTLRVACTGDSRAVLGSQDPSSGTYTATPLSKDQTGFNELELARVRAEHPGEPEVIDVKTSRVLGIAVSRAFGDGLWKWPVDIVLGCKARYFSKAPRPGYKTPPYLTAEPVITTTQIRGAEFMILASDGLWDHISSEEAVKLVELWMIARKEGTIGKQQRKARPALTAPMKLYGEEKWVVDINVEDFIVEDKNVAAHLVRNALGGANTERLCAVVGVQSPLSRDARDDITVQVVFFDK